MTLNGLKHILAIFFVCVKFPSPDPPPLPVCEKFHTFFEDFPVGNLRKP